MEVDTEGLADPDRRDPTFDAQLFVMATLLSSHLVYNFLGALNEEAISKLAFAAEMSKHVQLRMSASGSESSSPIVDDSATARATESFKDIFPRLTFSPATFTLICRQIVPTCKFTSLEY